MGLTIDSVQPIGGDDLLIAAHDAAGNTYEAAGWLSALTNHYDPADYGDDGNLKAGAKPRARTPEEVGEYALERILAAFPELVAPATVAADPIAFVTPAAAADVTTPADRAALAEADPVPVSDPAPADATAPA